MKAYYFKHLNREGFVVAFTAHGAKRKLADHFGVPPKFFEVDRKDLIVLGKAE